MKDKKSILEPEGIYHIYNRANGNELLFLNSENYRYFLEKFKEYVLPIADIYCYCLMPNHFHFLVRIKSREDLINLQGFKNLEGLSSTLTKQFSNFFNAYSKAFNKQYNRKGNLFMHTFKRKFIDSETYIQKVIHYIHFNPIEAGLAQSPEDWKFSSYSAIANPLLQTALKRNEVIEYFGDLENFVFCHTKAPDESQDLAGF